MLSEAKHLSSPQSCNLSSRAKRGICFCSPLVTSLLPQKFQQLRLGEFPLLARRQRLQRPFAARHFIIAENQRVSSAQFVRLTERLAEFLLHRRQLDAEARRA